MPSPRPAVRIIAMSVEPRESGEAARSVCPPNCPQLHFEQGQADRTSPRSPLTSPIPTWNINLSSHSHLKTGRDQLEAFAKATPRLLELVDSSRGARKLPRLPAVPPLGACSVASMKGADEVDVSRRGAGTPLLAFAA
jgi:hypothetical protein